MAGKNRIIRRIGIVVVIIAIAAIGFIAAFTYGSGQKLASSSGGDILGKLGDAELGDGTAVITSEDLNSLLGFVQVGNIGNGKLTVHGIGTSIEQGNLIVKLPVSYNGIKLLLSSKLEIGYTEQNIRLMPLSFEVGIIPIPKSLVMNKLKSYSRSKVNISDNYIDIAKDILPIAIDAITIKNDKLMVMVIKQPEVHEILTKIKEYDKKKLTAEGNSSVENTESKLKNAKTTTEKRDIILKNTITQLDVAATKCKTNNEKTLISMAKEVINKMRKDENYQYMKELDRFKAYYGGLSNAEMESVKAAILENVDTKTLMKLNSIY